MSQATVLWGDPRALQPCTGIQIITALVAAPAGHKAYFCRNSQRLHHIVLDDSEWAKIGDCTQSLTRAAQQERTQPGSTDLYNIVLNIVDEQQKYQLTVKAMNAHYLKLWLLDVRDNHRVLCQDAIAFTQTALFVAAVRNQHPLRAATDTIPLNDMLWRERP